MDASELEQLFREVEALETAASRLNQPISRTEILLIMVLNAIESVGLEMIDIHQIESCLENTQNSLTQIIGILNR
jgi:DUF1009 family protein